MVGTVTGVAVVTAPLTGPLIDRFGVRATAAGGGVALAAGYAGLAFARTPAAAFAAAAFAGAGNGALVPTQSTLLAALAPAGLRGRCMAAIGLSWWIGLALAPTLGTQLLSASLPATLIAAASIALAAGASALSLERRLPEASRLTPRPA